MRTKSDAKECKKHGHTQTLINPISDNAPCNASWVGGQTDSEGGNQTAITRSLPSSDKHSKHWDLIHSLRLLLFVMHTSGLHPT